MLEPHEGQGLNGVNIPGYLVYLFGGGSSLSWDLPGKADYFVILHKVTFWVLEAGIWGHSLWHAILGHRTAGFVKWMMSHGMAVISVGGDSLRTHGSHHLMVSVGHHGAVLSSC